MTSPFDKTETWVETGPDGLPYYVRKKQPPIFKLPSCKAILREAIHDLWHGPSPYWKELKRASKNRRKSASELAPASQVFVNPVPNNASRISLQPPVMQSPDEGLNITQRRGILKPEPQRFPSATDGGPPFAGCPPVHQAPPHPYPVMNPNTHQSYTGYPPQMGYNALQVHNPVQNHLSNLNIPPGPPQTHQPHFNLPPGPTQPPGGFQGPALPLGARATSPPRYPTQDDLKYKCAVCGRFRSANYHYRHPLAPGQLPGMTVCHNCRNTATDSENESIDSENSLEYTRGRRGTSRRARASSVRSRSRRSLSRHGRSRSRAVWSEDDRYYEEEPRRRRRSVSTSSSFDDGDRRRSGSVVMRRRRNPRVDEVEYVRRPRDRKVRRVVYVEDEDPEYHSDHDAEEVEVRTIRRAPRAPTPAPRRIYRQFSDPGLGSTYFVDRSGDYAARVPRHATQTSRPPSSHYRQEAYQSGSFDVEHDWYAPSPHPYHGRSRSRHQGASEHRRYGPDQVRPGTHGDPLSTPYPDLAEDRMAVVHHGDDARSTTSSRSMGRTSPAFGGPDRRPGLPPHVRQVDQQSSSDDYEWYDKNGMRIRVREI